MPVELTDGGRESVRFTGVVDEGAHIRPVGDDVASGAAVLTVGTRLGARQLSLAAAVGAETMTCIRKPVIGIAATGDELVNPGRELARGQIYESNATYLTAAARRKADELAAQAAALDAKRKVAEQLFDAVTGLLDCEELAGEVSESTCALIKNAHDVIAQATTTTTA